MKKVTCMVFVLMMSLGISGCNLLGSLLVPKHPEKSEAEFFQDKAMCEKKARAYTQERLVAQSYSDELEHTRRCMRDLGWKYFNVTPANEDKK